MLYVKDTPPEFAGSRFDVEQHATDFDWRWMLSAIGRRLWSVILVTLLLTASAVAYVALRPSHYTSHTHLQLTNLKLTFSRDDAFFAESQLDPTFLETQIQIMRSGKIAAMAMNNLRQPAAAPAATAAQKDGASSPSGPLGAASELYGEIRRRVAEAVPALQPAPERVEDPVEARREALKRLQRSYSAERVGLSNIVEIRFTASDPERAAHGANEIAQAYVEDQQAARVEAAQSASLWLRERLREVGPRTRVVAQALPPLEKSDPRGILIIAAACFSGALVGCAIAVARQLFDDSVRSPEQLERAIAAECLGIVPRLKKQGFRRWRRRPKPASERHVHDIDPLLLASVTQPMSEIGQTLWNVKVAIDDGLGRHGARCIGVTSSFMNEGASTIAANLARLVAARGERVILVDCDTTRGTLSSALTPRHPLGLLDCLRADGPSLADCVTYDGSSPLRFLPLGHARGEGELSQPLWCDAMTEFLQEASSQYDYVICDLPALVSGGNVRSAAQHLNGFVLVVGWGQVASEQLRVAVRSAGAFGEKLLGAVLNRTDMPDMRRVRSPAAAFLSRRTIKSSALRRRVPA